MSDRPQKWEVTMLLCDAAQVADGKLFVLGGGWSICGPGPFVHALALRISIPWDEANRRHQLKAVLKTEDFQPLVLPGQNDEIQFESDFEVGRPAGLPPGTSLDLPFAVNLGPLELPPGRGYVWSVSIDGRDVAAASFRTRPAG